MPRPDLRPVLCIAPVLPQDVRQQCRALSDADFLDKVICSLAYSEGSPVERSLRWLDRALGTQAVAATERRRLDAVPARAIWSQVWPELWIQVGYRLGLAQPGPAAADRYLARIDRAASRLLRPGIRLVIGREDSCFRAFAAARRLGASCLYDLPTAHYATVRAIMDRESAEFPGAGLEHDAAQEYRPARNRRKDAELAAADHILVPSQFVRNSLLAVGVPSERISVIPFGCQPPSLDSARQPPPGRKRVILYAGNVSVRKGIPRLLRAWKRLGAYRSHCLRLIGSMYLSPALLADYGGMFEYLPRVPRSELAKHYAAAYAFVMPAAAEGFAVVITEALAHGLPVIASENSGAAGFMTDREEGLLYPFTDEEKLCTALDRMLSRPEEVAQMSRAALALAARWTWEQYQKSFLRLVGTLLTGRNGKP